MKPAEDFDAYRRLYYWFQFHFFLRSEPSDRQRHVSDFLQQLVYREDDVHHRWELKERGAPPPDVVRIRRPPRGMNKTEATAEQQKIEDAKPVKPFHGVWLPRVASKESVRCRYMLFAWLRTKSGSKWDNFRSLYRSLVIFDLHKAGNTADGIAEHYNDFYLMEMSGHRRKTWVESAIREILGENNETELPKDSPHFLRYHGSAYDPKQAERMAKMRVNDHLTRASKLIELAKSGRFKDLSTLKPIKD